MPTKAAVPLVAAIFGLIGCHRSSHDCLSKTELTAKIAGNIYTFPAIDKPNATAQRKEDVFWISPAERSDGDLIACQSQETNPVELQSLTIAPVSLKPEVVQFSIDNVQRETRPLTSMREALAEPWAREQRTESTDSVELRTVDGRQLVGSCTPQGRKDVRGQPIPVMCDIRVKLGPHGALRLQYLQPDEPTDARQILMHIDQYLRAKRVGR